MKRQNGFTLVEILVVVFLLGIIVIVGSNLFFSILKGASKAEIEKEVKQNGDYAMNVMERMVRNAQEILQNSDGQTCESSMNKIKIKNPDGGETEFAFTGTRIASSGAYLTSENTALFSGAFSCDQTRTPPVVTISFTLSQAGTKERPEEKAQASFSTTVSLRSY
ncbi:MAG: PilW family protein [Patescibacteria group bacterium]